MGTEFRNSSLSSVPVFLPIFLALLSKNNYNKSKKTYTGFSSVLYYLLNLGTGSRAKNGLFKRKNEGEQTFVRLRVKFFKNQSRRRYWSMSPAKKIKITFKKRETIEKILQKKRGEGNEDALYKKENNKLKLKVKK